MSPAERQILARLDLIMVQMFYHDRKLDLLLAQTSKADEAEMNRLREILKESEGKLQAAIDAANK